MSDKFPNVPTWPGKTGYYEGPIPLPTTPPVRTQPCATPEGEPADEPYSMDDEQPVSIRVAASQAPAPERPEPTWQDVLEGKDKQILKLLATQALLLDDRDAWKARAEAAEKLASKRFEQVGEMATRSELDDRKIERLESENAQLRAEITHPVKPLQYDDCYDELRRHLSADLGLGIMAVRPEVLRRVLEYHDSLIASLPAPPSERDAQEGR